MASGIFAIFDDIAALMDDVALASKVATQKTVGILGDDLAVNAEKATGFLASRELPILWSITKGSFLNKIIIVPIALILNIFVPAAIKVILVLGGVFLAYEGVEKLVEFLLHRRKKKHHAVEDRETEDHGEEKAKIKSAIMTDFILSIEIVIIALGSVLDKPLAIQIMTVSIVAIIATIGVYGIVALIVRMDDAGLKLINSNREGSFLAKVGRVLVNALPLIIKALEVVGTIALILVSGGIFLHNIDYFHHIFPAVPSIIKEFSIGLMVGLIAFGVVSIIKKNIPVKKADQTP
jgi:predicted DNA repair protein MutK